MTMRLGTVLVFRPGVTKDEATTALKTIQGVLDPDYFLCEACHGDGRAPVIPGDRGGPTVTCARCLGTGAVIARVEAFNPDHGGPVWYIP